MARRHTRPASRTTRGAARVRSGVTTLFGFGLSVLVLAAASLAVIPAMIAADGEVAFGAIVLGQSIGGIGAAAVGYGWSSFGPARITGNSATVRRTEYVESIVAKLSLLLPVSAIAASLAVAFAPSMPLFAAVGAVSFTCVGLTASWYFVGLARPYTMLLLETLPRAGGTAVGIVLMNLGHSALAGPIGTGIGTIAGFTFSTAWVWWSTAREGAERVPRRALSIVLFSNRHATASILGFATYGAAPLMIVSVVNPAVQPAFALVQRIYSQVNVAVTPAVSVLQGWVPRATGSARAGRAGTALAVSSLLAVALGAGMIILGPPLTNWLGHGQISVSWVAIVLMSACISANLFKWVLESVVLAAFERLDVVTVALVISSMVGLPLVAFGAVFLGTIGALGGVLSGLLTCIFIDWVGYTRRVRPLGLATT